MTSKLLLFLKVSLFWTAYLAIIFIASRAEAFMPPAFAKLAWGTTSSVLILILTMIFLRRERRELRDVGLGFDSLTPARLAVGLLLAFATYGLILLLVSTLVGPIRLVWAPRLNRAATLLSISTTFVLVCMEELGMRGYPLRTLVPALGYWPAQFIVAIAFGVCHKLFNYSWLAILLGVIPSALLFGATAIASRGLAMPIGVHAGLNLAQWSVGEQGSFWATNVADVARARIVTFSPVIVVSVMVVATILVWLCSRRASA
jgi:membrane protease YdiL (CAAX protease family)